MQKTCLLALFHSNGYIRLHKKADFLTACSAASDLCLTVNFTEVKNTLKSWQKLKENVESLCFSKLRIPLYL